MLYLEKVAVWNTIIFCNRMNDTSKGTFRDKVRHEVLLKFYTEMSIPRCLYGCETWTMTNAHDSRLKSTDMRLLRSVPGYTLSLIHI